LEITKHSLRERKNLKPKQCTTNQAGGNSSQYIRRNVELWLLKTMCLYFSGYNAYSSLLYQITFFNKPSWSWSKWYWKFPHSNPR